MTEASTQLASAVSDHVASWYRELELMLQLFLANTPEPEEEGGTAVVSEQMEGLQSSVFQEIGLVTQEGGLLLSTGEIYDASREPYIQQLLADGTGKTCVGGMELDGFEDKVVFGVPCTDAQRGEERSGSGIAGVVGTIGKAELSEMLETDIFGENMAYVVIADPAGNVIVQTNAQKQFGDNLVETIASFAPRETVEQLSGDLAAGKRNTLDIMGVTKEFMVYYTPVLAETAAGALSAKSDLASNAGGEDTYSAGNWRLMVLTRVDVLGQNVTMLFHESKITLYIILVLLLAVLIILVCLFVRKRNHELTLVSEDSLTGLLKDGCFYKDGNLLLARNKHKYALVCYNIAQFKLINTRIGHQEADVILRMVGQSIQGFLQEDELAARSFADCFIVLMRMDTEAGEARIRELEERLTKKTYPHGVELKFTIGVYRVKPEDESVSIGVDRARFAQSKTREGLSVLSNMVVYSQEMFEKQKEEGALAEKAEHALEEKHFVVYYQLKRNIQKDDWQGTEALVRWKDPEQGFIYPGSFIPLFEQNGFVVKLDLYVFETVCRDLRELLKREERVVPVSVNLSKCHLENEKFLDEYENILNRYNIPRELIEFEITESMLVKNPEQMKQVIDRIHAMGCQCSLDDFGTGYSSFNMVKEFSFDTIKLDRSFFYGSRGFDRDSRMIVETLIDLSHKLGKTVVSEGIENQEQAEFLLLKQCDAIQGFFYSKPGTIDQCRVMLNG